MKIGIPIMTCALLVAAHASAGEPLEDLPGRQPPIEDLVPRPRRAGVAGGDGASVSVLVATRHRSATHQRERRGDIAGSIVVTWPTDLFVSSSRKAKGGTALEPPGVRASPRSDDFSRYSIIRPRDARAAVAAAQRAAGLPAVSADLDGMASRARWSAVLPRLRLRATRLIDESSSLSPTSYDPRRTTSSGGASLWLEARTTWELNRLVFASEEVRIERMQHRVRDEAQDIQRRIVSTLLDWQGTRARMMQPTVHPEQCFELWLEIQQFAISLDVDTGGWFRKWRARRGIAPVSCDQESSMDRSSPSGGPDASPS